MRLDQVSYGQTEMLQLRIDGGEEFPTSFVPGAEVALRYSPGNDVYLVSLGLEVVSIVGEGRDNAGRLSDICTRHWPMFAWVMEAAKVVLKIQVHTFLNALTLPPLEIGIDEKSLESIQAYNKGARSPQMAIDWLRNQYLVPGEVESRAFVGGDLQGGSGAFAFHGLHTRASVRRVTSADGADVMVLDKIARTKNHNDSPVTLVHADVRFVDATVVGRIQAEALGQLNNLANSGSSFLDVWNRYGAIENEAALRRARQSGSLAYDHFEPLADGRFKFFLSTETDPDDSDRFKKAISGEGGTSIEAAGDLPEVLRREMSWAEYEQMPRGSATGVSAFDGKIELNRRERTVVLSQSGNDEVSPPHSGHLFVSLQGDRTRLKRRETAWKQIREARCPMPQLGLLLEGKAVPAARRGTTVPLSPNVKKKVFGQYNPTATQEEAIRVALNTPDIALIQGPPGTGKTTIIVALVERLQEIWDTSGGVQGRLLLSGFQHDAVENAIQRMSVNGLPPIKFGGRRNRQEDIDRVDATIDGWRRERAAAIRAKMPVANDRIHEELGSEIVAYFLAPGTMEQTAALIGRIADRLSGHLSAGLSDSLHELRRDLTERAAARKAGDPEREKIIRAIRALRDLDSSFADDGPRNAFRLQRELARRSELEAAADKLLSQAASWTRADAPPFLAEIAKLRRQLLLRYIPSDRTRGIVPQLRKDVLEILSNCRDEIEQRHRGTRNAADDVVLSFMSALENDPAAVKHAVVSYTSVFAATCQQCQPTQGSELAFLKGDNNSYDTVVVDEAARATPLDLFIPMAKAARRIVLVGDHRQLPHILDRELERELEQELATEATASRRTAEMLNESLFKRLFEDLKQRETLDGICRTVTLDEQYRMHPVLGDFVSEQFYPATEAFRSPRPASDFIHALPGYSSPAAWLRVPRRSATAAESSAGFSKARHVEARAIVGELQRLMSCDSGRQLTFGVIAFYAAQREALNDELVRAGMAHRSETGEAEIADPYREICLESGRYAERLRVGTVDAFQGMEFDVVFLSMVRSNALPDGDERARRRKYGHLMSSNRMCVAMSRQKKLLIVAGDDEMLVGDGAAAAVGPLVRFREMSEVHDASGL